MLKDKKIPILTIVLIVLSCIAIIIGAIVIGINFVGKNESSNAVGANASQELPSEEFETNKGIIDDINLYIYPITEEEAVKYIDEKAAEYIDKNVGLPIAQIKVNMYYNAFKNEEAYRYGQEIEDRYPISKYPLFYQSDFYLVMMKICEKLGYNDDYNSYRQKFIDVYHLIYGEESTPNV